MFNFVPNVVSFLLMLGERRWYSVGSYVPPNNEPSMYRVYQALKAVPKEVEVILLGDLNFLIRDP